MSEKSHPSASEFASFHLGCALDVLGCEKMQPNAAMTGRATVLSLPDISAFDEGTAVDKPIVASYLTIEMSGINSMPDLDFVLVDC